LALENLCSGCGIIKLTAEMVDLRPSSAGVNRSGVDLKALRCGVEFFGDPGLTKAPQRAALDQLRRVHLSSFSLLTRRGESPGFELGFQCFQFGFELSLLLFLLPFAFLPASRIALFLLGLLALEELGTLW
jgi:hypothetical protein